MTGRHPFTVDAYWSEDVKFLYIGRDFFPGGSAEDTNTGKLHDPINALEYDVLKYKDALGKAPAGEPFVNFPFPTNPVIKMVEIINMIPMLMGHHTLPRLSPTPATPAGLVNSHTTYAQSCSILAFLAYADPERFKESRYPHGSGKLGMPKSGLVLENPAIPHSSSSKSPKSPKSPHSSRPPSPHHRRQMQKSRF